MAHRRDRATLIVALAAITLVSWTWIVVMARDMYGPMTGASAWMMTPHWDAPHLLLLWTMWAVMMTAMMLPSATPMVMLARTHAYALALGYVSVWALFSLGATALQWVLGRTLAITPMMEASSARVSAAFLLIALALGLADVFMWPPWAGFFVVGIGLGLISLFAYLAARRRLYAVSMVPEETVTSLKENSAWIAKRLSSEPR